MIIMSVFVKNLKNSFLIILLRLRFQANQKSHIYVSYHFKNGQVWPRKADTVYIYRVNTVEIPSKYFVTFFMQQTLITSVLYDVMTKSLYSKVYITYSAPNLVMHFF